MPIKGSFAETATRHLAAIDAMCRETTEESVEAIQDRVQENTPVITGALKESVVTTPVVQDVRGDYTAAVESDLEYAPYVEFGTSPHVIQPNDAEALAFDGRVVAEVHHPGNRGRHMFRQGAIEFEQGEAEAIAKKNVKKHLGTV
jgi:hypothetical protein